jgi:hypothetical protein
MTQPVSLKGRGFLTADEQDTRRWKRDVMPKTFHIYGIYLCSSSASIYVHLRLSNSFLYFKTASEGLDEPDNARRESGKRLL